MDTVSFTAMADGTREEYEFLARKEAEEAARVPGRILAMLASMDEDTGYRVTRLEHSLQSATRAHRDGRDEDYVVMCLVHDIGDMISPANHSQAAASVLRPYVSDDLYWIVLHHGIFQGFYYFHHYGQDRNARDQFKNHPLYEATVEFCADYDQNCFDPDYDSEPLDFFAPMVERVFGRSPRSFV
jgi:predicted HD phosphohydrolase